MAASWAGFTDEDIVRIKTSPDSKRNKNVQNISPPETWTPMKLVVNGGFQHSDASKDDTSDPEQGLQRNPRESKKKPKETAFESMEHFDGNTWEKNDLSDDSSSDNSKRETEDQNFESNPNIQDLELFEMRQKRIEAENARRRALINKAITDKQLRTEAESVKLSHIAQELRRLDSVVGADVAILRDCIDRAAADFAQAEKRYLRAEREFIEAKLQLYERLQRKEQLTEHLCAIIEHNEDRKAERLVQLMRQLDMDAPGDDQDPLTPILSKFCILNDEAYHCCSTLKPPSPKLPTEEANEQRPPGESTTDNSTCDQKST